MFCFIVKIYLIQFQSKYDTLPETKSFSHLRVEKLMLYTFSHTVVKMAIKS
jgi:hypothetical protein